MSKSVSSTSRITTVCAAAVPVFWKDTVHSTAGDGTAVTLQFRVTTTEFEEEDRIDLTDLDFFVPATAKELLATLADDPHAPILLSPALAVVVGRLLMGPRPSSVLEGALRA